jgi:hypothetical protein
MAHSYTPGLKVLKSSIIDKNRRLPIKGEVRKKVGDSVLPDDIVAKTNLPGNVQIIKVASQLNIGPADILEALKVSEGEQIKKGQLLAQTGGLFGLFKSEIFSPIDGTIESISDVTGQIIMREAPIPVEIDAYTSGIVKDIIPEEGVIIETKAAFIQGIFGIGGEARGILEIIVQDRNDEITPEMLNSSQKGKVIVGGGFIGLEAFKKAISLNISGIVIGGFNYYDLKEILGYNLGVAITGSEDINTSLIVTEGYGHIKMSRGTFSLLKENENNFCSINGATQIRAGVIRPEIVIPVKEDSLKSVKESKIGKGIVIGSLVRVIRAPFFGLMGKVTELPSKLQKMESETLVRVAKINVDDQDIIIPRSNLEMVETD